MIVPRRGFATICVIIWSPVALAAPALSDDLASGLKAFPFHIAQADNAPTGQPPETETNQKKPPEPAAKSVCYKEVNQVDCDCAKYEKTGSSQWRLTGCADVTDCESPENQCE